MVLLWDRAPDAAETYRFALGDGARVVEQVAELERVLREQSGVTLVVVGPDIELDEACRFAASARVTRPSLGVLLLRHRLDVTVLSQALRSGMRDVVPAAEQAQIADAVRHLSDLSVRLGAPVQAASGPGGHVVTVFAAKGGVGKTTVATNTAVHLARSGKSTLLIDLDLAFGDVAIALQLPPDRGLAFAATMGELDRAALRSLVTAHPASGLDVLTAPGDPAEGEQVPATVLAPLLTVARAAYDYVVIDTPPAFTDHVLAACDESDLLLLVTTLDIAAVKNLRLTLDTLDALGQPADARAVVLNHSTDKVGLGASDVAEAIGRPVTVSIPSDLAVPTATNHGTPVVAHAPRAAAADALRVLTDTHLRGRFEADVAPASRAARRGLLSLGGRR